MSNKKCFIFLFLIMVFVVNAFPCTIFCTHSGGEVWAGNSEDWIDQDTLIWFIPGTDTKYGMVMTGFNNGFAQGGMNEKGLFFDWFLGNSSKNPAPNDPDKLNYKGSLSEKILAECATVSEALEYFDKYNAPSLGPSIILLADAEGDSAAVRWNWDESKIEITKTTDSYQAIGVNHSLVENDLTKNSTDLSLSRFTSLLDKAKQPKYTVYSSVYDLANKNVYLYYNQNFTHLEQWNLTDELKKPVHLYRMRDLFPEEAENTGATFLLFQRGYFSYFMMFAAAILIYLLGIRFWLLRITKRKGKLKIESLSKPEKRIIYSGIGLNLFNNLLYGFAVILLLFYPAFIGKYGFGIVNNTLALVPVFIIIFTVIQILFCIVHWIKRYLPFSERIAFTVSTLIFMFSSGLYIFMKNMYF